MGKVLAETTGNFMLVDPANSQNVLPHDRPGVIEKSAFFEERAMRGQIRVLNDELPDDATDAQFAEQWENDGEKSAEKYRGPTPAQRKEIKRQEKERLEADEIARKAREDADEATREATALEADAKAAAAVADAEKAAAAPSSFSSPQPAGSSDEGQPSRSGNQNKGKPR